MDELELSGHARLRVAARGFRREELELLVDYGRRRQSHGATIYFMDRKTRATVRDAVGAKAYARLEPRLDAYVVVAGDGTVVTAAKRLRRFHA